MTLLQFVIIHDGINASQYLKDVLIFNRFNINYNEYKLFSIVNGATQYRFYNY